MTQIVSIREELKSYSYCETAVIQLNVTECIQEIINRLS